MGHSGSSEELLSLDLRAIVSCLSIAALASLFLSPDVAVGWRASFAKKFPSMLVCWDYCPHFLEEFHCLGRSLDLHCIFLEPKIVRSTRIVPFSLCWHQEYLWHYFSGHFSRCLRSVVVGAACSLDGKYLKQDGKTVSVMLYIRSSWPRPLDRHWKKPVFSADSAALLLHCWYWWETNWKLPEANDWTPCA